MKPTKEKCIDAINTIVKVFEKFGVYQFIKSECDMIADLINEHFDNPPLRFEEIELFAPVYCIDEYGGNWCLVESIDHEKGILYLVDAEENGEWALFALKQFYRKRVD